MLVYAASEEIYPLSEDASMRLGEAFQMLYDSLLDSMAEIRRGDSSENTWLYCVLPPIPRAQMDFLPCREFIAALMTLADKVFGPLPMTLACRAEELLLSWAVEMTEIEEDRETEEDAEIYKELSDFLTGVLYDTDFEFMYDPKMDGIEYMKGLGVGSLASKDWFLPFHAGAITNPMTWPDEKKYCFEKWQGFEYPELS